MNWSSFFGAWGVTFAITSLILALVLMPTSDYGGRAVRWTVIGLAASILLTGTFFSLSMGLAR